MCMPKRRITSLHIFTFGTFPRSSSQNFSVTLYASVLEEKINFIMNYNYCKICMREAATEYIRRLLLMARYHAFSLFFVSLGQLMLVMYMSPSVRTGAADVSEWGRVPLSFNLSALDPGLKSKCSQSM